MTTPGSCSPAYLTSNCLDRVVCRPSLACCAFRFAFSSSNGSSTITGLPRSVRSSASVRGVPSNLRISSNAFVMAVPQSPVTFMLRSIVRCMSSKGSVRDPALCEDSSRCSSSVSVMRSRCVERTVAVSPLTNLTSAQMWPFVWRQCLNTTPRAPDRLARTCMSRRRSMPIFALRGFCGFGPAQLRERRAACHAAFR